MKGVVVGGTASGVGKTVASLVVMRALENACCSVQPAKAGPDFIDPSHHTAVIDRPSRTLDVWLEGIDGTRRNYYRGKGDVCVVEGVMGLFDGENSSTATVAETLHLPVVLVVDASAGMESVAATALGFHEYASRIGSSLEIPGIIAQRAHGGRHEQGIRDALPDELHYFGRIPPLDGLEIPERHLGLHMGAESPIDIAALDTAAEHICTEKLLEIATTPPRPEPIQETEPTDTRVAVAQDDAFRFIYPATVERLRQRADVVTFAPTTGDDVPPCDGVYLPGGYPELFASHLADSQGVESLRELSIEEVPIYGECGGMMVLAEALTTIDGDTHEMAGVLPARVRMHDHYQALDHVDIEAAQSAPTAAIGDRLHGHEFHYSSASIHGDARFVFDVRRGSGIDGEHDGLIEYRTLGTYSHVHAESGAFDTFVDTLARNQ